MSKINQIQRAILEIEGGRYQNLMDAYLFKKMGLSNMVPYGSQPATDKTTKGVPDTYIITDDNKYILIMYGTVQKTSYNKMKKDIESCLKLKDIPKDKIHLIISCYTSTDISPGEHSTLMSLFENVRLIGIEELSNDLYFNYPGLARELLSISIDTCQILDVDNFIAENDKNNFSTTLDMPLLCREDEKLELTQLLNTTNILLIAGASGIGKTRLALETAQEFAFSNNYKVKIIKNNGEPIYEDLKVHFCDDADYIVLVDDANQLANLGHLLRISVDKKRIHSLKIMLTVRDYARDFLNSKIREVTKLTEYTLKPLSDDFIKNILTSNLNIKNSHFLERILKIAKGNIRLAIMAGTCSLEEGGLGNIQNAFEIFDRYYFSIISEFKKQELISLALMAFFDKFKISSEELIYQLALMYEVDNSQLTEYCNKFSKEEIVSIFNDLAAKFDNQNLSDYILYYVLFKEKWVSIYTLITMTFPKYRGRLVFTLSTLTNLFYSEDTTIYLKSQVDKAWEDIRNGDKNIQLDFLEAFHQLLEDETLVFVKNEILSLPYIKTDFKNFDFNGKSSHQKIDSKILKILGSFKHSELLIDSLDLILMHLARNTNSPMDFYFIFYGALSIERSSYINDYKNENLILEYLLDRYEENLIEEIGYCLLFFIKNLLKFEFTETEMNGDAYNLYTYSIISCDGLLQLRSKCIKALSVLRKNVIFTHEVNDVLLKYNARSDKADIDVLSSDINNFDAYIFSNLNYESFDDCIILHHYYAICKRNKISIPESILTWENNNNFVRYCTLARDRYKQYDSWQEEEAAKEKAIKKMTESMNISDYSCLFAALNEATLLVGNSYKLNQGMRMMFECVSYSKELYGSVMNLYLDYGAPFGEIYNYFIYQMRDIYGYELSKETILKYDFPNKSNWIKYLNDIIPDENITLAFCKEILLNLNAKNPLLKQSLLSFKTAKRIEQVYKGFLSKYLDKLLKATDDPFIISDFIDELLLLEDEDITEAIGLFGNKLDGLKKAYIISLSTDIMDDKGKLFLLLVKDNLLFLKDIIDFYIKSSSYNIDVLHFIWNLDNYKDMVKFAFDYIILKCQLGFLAEINLRKIFFDDIDEEFGISEKQISWIKEYIDENIENKRGLNGLLRCVANMKLDARKELILYYCDKNPTLSQFKEISFFPSTFTWSGSEVPYIENRIAFLHDIKDNLKGSFFIEHRVYLSEEIKKYQRQKEAVLLNEFLGIR